MMYIVPSVWIQIRHCFFARNLSSLLPRIVSHSLGFSHARVGEVNLVIEIEHWRLIRSEVSCDVEYCIETKLVGLRMIMRVGQGQAE